MIILEKLEFSNMYSYGDNNILQLNKDSITQLTAPNGSGKSTLALIIQELLYSKNVKAIKKSDIINRYIGTNEWAGELSFYSTSDKKKYRVRVRRKGASAKVSFYEGDTDISEHKVPDTYKSIKNILGMDFEIFSQLTYQSSTDLLDFLKATDTNRKKFLINLFNLEKYINIGEVIKIKNSQVDKDYNMQLGELRGIERFLEDTVIPKKLENIIVPDIAQSLLERRGVLKLEIENHESLNRKIDNNNLYIQEQNNLIFDMSLQKPIETVTTQEISNITADIKSINIEIRKIKKQISNIDITEVCHTCGQKIDNTLSTKLMSGLEEDINELGSKLYTEENDLEKKENTYSVYVNHLRYFKDNDKSIERFEQLSQLIDNSLPVNHSDIVEIRRELEEIDSILSKQILARDTNLKHNEQVNTHNTKVEGLIEQKQQYLARQQLLNNDIISIKNQVGNLTILKKAFSTSGIVAFKLENLTKELEDTINGYLAELSDGQFQIIFRLTGEKLNIIVRNHGKETPIETVSGGEFSRIQTAILLAVRNILSKIGGNSVNLLFLDEITGVLDEAGKEKLIEVLRKEQDLNVFIISHDFSHPLVDKIEIRKEDNISRII